MRLGTEGSDPGFPVDRIAPVIQAVERDKGHLLFWAGGAERQRTSVQFYPRFEIGQRWNLDCRDRRRGDGRAERRSVLLDVGCADAQVRSDDVRGRQAIAAEIAG